MNKRTFLIIILLVVIAIALPLTVFLVQQQQELRSKAAPATTLAFSPSSGSAAVGVETAVDIVMNTGSNQVTAAELSFTFDPSFVQTSPAPRIIKGSGLTVELVQGSVLAGTASITVGANPGSPATGSNLQIARLSFTPAKTGTMTLRFAQTVRLAGVTEGSNVLASQPPDGTIIITGAGPTNTPLPTSGQATPTPTATLTPTPTGNVGIGGSAPPGTCTDTKPAGAPTITGAASGVNKVVLTWTQAADPVTHYSLTYGLAPGEQRFGATNIGDKNIRTYTVGQLSGGTTYYFKIKGVNGCAQGTASNEASSTPTGGQVQGPPPPFTTLITTTPIIQQPTPTLVEKPIGKDSSLSPNGQKPGELTPTTVFLGIGAFLLLIGGIFFFL